MKFWLEEEELIIFDQNEEYLLPKFLIVIIMGLKWKYFHNLMKRQ